MEQSLCGSSRFSIQNCTKHQVQRWVNLGAGEAPVEWLLPTAVIHALPGTVLFNSLHNYLSGAAGRALAAHRGKLESNSSFLLPQLGASISAWFGITLHTTEPSSATYFISQQRNGGIFRCWLCSRSTKVLLVSSQKLLCKHLVLRRMGTSDTGTDGDLGGPSSVLTHWASFREVIHLSGSNFPSSICLV